MAKRLAFRNTIEIAFAKIPRENINDAMYAIAIEGPMSKFLAVAFVVTAALAMITPADARGGCGVGWHRGPHGGCLHNGEAAVVVTPDANVIVVAPKGRVCPVGWHLGPLGHCRRN